MIFKKIFTKQQALKKLWPSEISEVKKINRIFQVEYAYNYQGFMGNMLTRRETKEVIETGIACGNKHIFNYITVLNLVKVNNHIDRLSMSDKKILWKDFVHLHKLLFSVIDDDHAGKLRKVTSTIDDYFNVSTKLTPIEEIHIKFEEWLHKEEHWQKKIVPIHLKCNHIRPFTRNNTIVIWLLTNYLLKKSGLPVALLKKEDSEEYRSIMKRAHLSKSQEDFQLFLEKAVNRSLDFYIKLIKTKAEPNTAELLKIGMLSKQAKASVATIRYWTKNGLLSVSDFSKGGYQLYAVEMIDRISFIRECQSSRLTLTEIKEKVLARF